MKVSSNTLRIRSRKCSQSAPVPFRRGLFLVFLLGFLANLPAANAAATHPATIDSFVAGAFSQAPAAETLWLTPELKAQAKQTAGFAPDGARIRYWKAGNRTAWVIDRIGKEAPITFGVVIEGNAVAGLQVLTYRESRGFEIQSARWLAQYIGVRSAGTGKPGTAPEQHSAVSKNNGGGQFVGHNGLDRAIDNISGATLSVRASRDVVRLALYLHQTVLPAAAANTSP